jgi:tetratricopeptide (TPR) repeat protein
VATSTSDFEMKDPMSLLDKGKYEKALHVQQLMLEKDPNDGAALTGLPYTYLCLGRLEEALEGFLQSNARAKLKPVGEKQPYLMDIGAIQWLLGRREDAVHTFRSGVDGILDGTIEFADLAGGVYQGLFLWYAGVSKPDHAAREHALSFLRGLAANSRIEYWPGPLAEFAIGKLSREQLLQEIYGTKLMWCIRMQTQVQRHKRFKLSDIWFHFGVQARAQGDEAECQRCMLECSRLGSGPSNLEWHLAKAEVRQTPSPVSH